MERFENSRGRPNPWVDLHRGRRRGRGGHGIPREGFEEGNFGGNLEDEFHGIFALQGRQTRGRQARESRTVKDYYKEMEMLMMRLSMNEDCEATMARFLSGLNREITNQVELQQYVELEDMLHMAIKIKNQFKRKGTSSRFGHISNSGRTNSSVWRSNPIYEARTKPKQGDEITNQPRRDVKTEPTQATNFEGNGELVSESEYSEEEIKFVDEEIGDEEHEEAETLKASRTELSLEFNNVFPKEIPNGLPHFRGIEYQIDFMPGAVIPNRPA
ncbi:hypothetical protein FEM48_Zijuj09G0141000 [Ziziphus jujuba var. spinosa]|uniref:Retrotransposon gag domain-containing protein n=1 Tax=Ziziphus jujuba var. spinosa TaxID=714518 RepID=A0A978UTE8_ZIZJJ|nr:hypothetical protein FEM48_Zijuj09G0141000 [Ziziphus jujuba var. spinosa]